MCNKLKGKEYMKGKMIKKDMLPETRGKFMKAGVYGKKKKW